MHLFFSVGEPSGDLHGANLIRELQVRQPGTRCVGFGGPLMRDVGLDLHADLTEKAVMWVSRVLSNLYYFIGLLRRANRYFAESPPDAVVLIDYPGFNWWVARAAKKHGIPVIYYGTPQLWAWAPWRVRKMRRLVDHALCKLPFEEGWFRSRGVNATHVGHPYFDELAMRELDGQFVKLVRSRAEQVITILPGSRDQEVESNLPWLLKAAQQVHMQVRDVHFHIAAFNRRHAVVAKQLVANHLLPAEIHVGRTPELIEAADSCLACSGSVSLELLYHRKPAVVLYSVSRAAFMLQAVFRTAKYITLTNLLADHHGLNPPVPEYLTCNDASLAMGDQMVNWCTDREAYDRNRDVLGELRDRDGRPGASARAADYIVEALKKPVDVSRRAA